jgi:cell division protein FtsW
MAFKNILISKRGGSPDYFIMALVFALTIFGLIMLASASSELGVSKFNDSYFYLKHQIIYGLAVGLVGFFLAFKIYYQNYRRFAVWLLTASLIFLVLVFTPLGLASGGAERWLKLGPLSFQPAEIIKITFIIYLAAWLTNSKANRTQSFSGGFLPFLIISGLIAGLLILEPTTGTVVIILGSALLVYFFSGAKFRYIFLTILIGFSVLALIIYVTPYRFARLKTYLSPSKDQQGSAYQINQSLINIGTGGWLGIGYGKSTMKTNLLPAPLDDSIFSIVASELGFIGASALIVVFFLLALRIFYLAFRTEEKFARSLLVGFGSIIFIQSFMNIASISGLLPLTGVPLPFISYGGTALAVFLTMSGIIINISKYTNA